MDFAGTIEAVGEGVGGYSVGDEVYGCAGGLAELPGTLAEHIVADRNLVAHKPKNLSMREAAALPLVGITAYEGLQRAGITAGQKVLVHGGSGGVGHVALQLAAHSPGFRKRPGFAGFPTVVTSTAGRRRSSGRIHATGVSHRSVAICYGTAELSAVSRQRRRAEGPS